MQRLEDIVRARYYGIFIYFIFGLKYTSAGNTHYALTETFLVISF